MYNAHILFIFGFSSRLSLLLLFYVWCCCCCWNVHIVLVWHMLRFLLYRTVILYHRTKLNLTWMNRTNRVCTVKMGNVSWELFLLCRSLSCIVIAIVWKSNDHSTKISAQDVVRRFTFEKNKNKTYECGWFFVVVAVCCYLVYFFICIGLDRVCLLLL